MTLLIVNADDLGIHPERDRGIFEAHARGIVCSASLIVNGVSARQAAERAITSGLPVGIHLNLSEGQSLTGTIPGLTDTRGQFPGKQGLRDALQRSAVDGQGIRDELRTQVNRAREFGIDPDHLDSHQHFHLFPAMLRIVLDLAREEGIPAVRRSLPAEPAESDPHDVLGKEMRLYRSLAHETPALIAGASDIAMPDGLWGMPNLTNLDTERLCDLLEHIPPGRWELMVHPGYPAGEGFGGRQRQLELEALLSTEVKATISRCAIRLISFGDLACAS